MVASVTSSSKRDGVVPQPSWLPDFCSAQVLFAVMIGAEFLVFIILIAPSDETRPLIPRLTTASLFVQWLALVSAVCLCKLRPQLERLAPWAGVADRLRADASGHRTGQRAGFRHRPQLKSRTDFAGAIPGAIRLAQRRIVRSYRRCVAALLLCVRTMACARARRSEGTVRSAAGAHPPAFPVQQHEHDRQPDSARGRRKPSGRSKTSPICSAPRSARTRRPARWAKSSIW